jgi:hypothetical protein
MSSRAMPAERNVPSWSRRMLVLDYYDGVKDAVVECAEGHIAILRMLDWDDLQDTRIFAVVEERTERFDTLATLVAESATPQWPVFVPTAELSEAAKRYVDHLLASTNRLPDYVIAAVDPGKTIIVGKNYLAGSDADDHQWFVEFGLQRHRDEIDRP